MRRFVRYTLINIPWFTAIIGLMATIGYLQGDLVLAKFHWQWLAGAALTVTLVSAVGAAQAMFGEWRQRRRNSN